MCFQKQIYVVAGLDTLNCGKEEDKISVKEKNLLLLLQGITL